MEFVGVALLALSASLYWLLTPRDGQEKRIMQLPLMWGAAPLAVTVCLGGGVLMTLMGLLG